MLTIRLQRAGKRNSPQYRLVLARSTAANQKQFVEVLGSYNPHSKELLVRDQSRLDYWLKEQHVPTSETVHNLFVTKGIISASKVKAFTLPKKEAPAEESSAESATAAEAPAEAEQSTESPEAAVEPASEEPASEPAPVVEDAPETESPNTEEEKA